MKKQILFAILIFFLVNKITAKNFSKLDHKDFYLIEYTSKQNEYIAVNLNINLQKSDIKNVVLKVFYFWENDTLFEYFPINAIASKTLKYLNIDKGKKLTVGIQVVGNHYLDKISGEIEIKPTNVNDIKTDNELIIAGGYVYAFPYSYNFKVDIKEISSNKMIFNFITNENFIEDKLHVQITYTMPNGVFGTEKKSLDVNTDEFLTFEKKKHTLSFSNFVKYTGVYTFKIEFLNNSTILNGLSEISIQSED